MLKPTKILVPTDFSEFSDKALKQAIDIARRYKAKVYLLHVISGELHRVIMDYAIPERVILELEKQQTDSALQMLRQQLEKFPTAGEVEVEIVVARGNPYEAILEEEKIREIDLIVIASLGRTGLARYLIGGVARNVLKGASAPVLLTK